MRSCPKTFSSKAWAGIEAHVSKYTWTSSINRTKARFVRWYRINVVICNRLEMWHCQNGDWSIRCRWTPIGFDGGCQFQATNWLMHRIVTRDWRKLPNQWWFVWRCLARTSCPAIASSESCSLKIMLSATLRSARPCVCWIPGRRFASHGAPQFNEPSGYLFGEKVRSGESLLHWENQSDLLYVKPLPPGQKRVKEDWENVWYWGMFGTMAFAAVLLYYKPDTRCVRLKDFLSSTSLICQFLSIQTWALQEAKNRMEARGEKYKYEPSSSSSSSSS